MMSSISEDGKYYITKQQYTKSNGEIVYYDRKNKRSLKTPGEKSKPGKPPTITSRIKSSIAGLSDDQLNTILQFITDLKKINN